MEKRRYVTLLLALLVSMASFAQKRTFTGVVVDDQNEPVIGASVVQKGTSNGAVTDLDGNFTVSVEPGATLVVSFVGYVSQEVKAANGMHIVLKQDQKMLEEVVVVGYGVQKKSVVTASIAKVTADDLNNTAPVRVDNALKGLAAGVNVTSASGQPGAYARIRVRGTGTINDSDPLIIVDGMPVGQNGLDFVNPNDVESIEVLKDAASGAIYGARAANGVILITTKKGKTGKAQISYNFSKGWQSKWRKRDVLSATDYAILQNESLVNAGQAPRYLDPYNLTDSNGMPIVGAGHDWQDYVFNDNAPVVNHDVTVSGASEKVNYYLSMGYYSQEGIVGGNFGQSNYNRFTVRSNTMFNLLDAEKERNFLNKLDLSVNVAYMRTHSSGIEANTMVNGVLGSTLYMPPLLAPTAIDWTDANGVAHNVATDLRSSLAGSYLPTDANGNPYSVPAYVGAFNDVVNPLAMLSMSPTRGWSHKIVPKFAVDLQLWDNLKYHFNYSADMSFYGNSGGDKELYYLSGAVRRDHTSVSVYKGNNVNWQVENTLTYDKTIDKHTFGVVLGQSAMKYKGDELSAWKWGLVNPDKQYINYTNGVMEYTKDANGNITGATVPYGVGGYMYPEHRMSSLFGRVSYNYDERYMFQATVRRDGSSRFGPNNKYGTFPSASVGWNIHNEKFMEQTRDWLSNLKLRASWGKNGNDNIPDFSYTTMTEATSGVFFGTNATKHAGSKAQKTANADLKWEESEQTDLGLDFGFFNNALTLTVDYYVKKTNGMIIEMPIPNYVGERKPQANVGDMENKGIEFELGYKWSIGDAKFAVKGNATYLKNTLKNLGNDTGFLPCDYFEPGIAGGYTRAENGKPYPFFYGYKTAGIFQTMDEVNSYTWTNPETGIAQLIQPDAKPGDVRFVDMNNDGQINDDDRTDIGNGTPDWTFGLNLNAEWKGFDFNVFFQGVTGADVFDATYRSDIYAGNYPTWMLGRWTGPGTSDKYPILRQGDSGNWRMSDLYVCDGSYLRLKNISLGYTLPRQLTQKLTIERLRVYVMADNLITWTKYWGFDPEISSGGSSLGCDRGVYPQARTWTVGLNVSF